MLFQSLAESNKFRSLGNLVSAKDYKALSIDSADALQLKRLSVRQHSISFTNLCQLLTSHEKFPKITVIP